MEEFENSLIKCFNEAQLPLEAKRYVVLAFFRNVEDAYRSEMNIRKETANDEQICSDNEA